MKIAYLSTFYPYRGGIAQFNALLYRALEKISDVKAFTFTRQYPDFLFPGKSQFVNQNDTTVDKIKSERVLDTLNPISYYRTSNRIHSFKPDLLLMKYWISYMAPSLGKVSGILKKKDVKVITILDNVISHEKKTGETLLTKYFLKKNDGFIVMSDRVKNDLLSILPSARYILKQHPPYNTYGNRINSIEAKNKLGLPSDKKIILFFGFIRDYKGLDILIDSLKYLEEDIHLLIAGEVYGSFEKYQKLINLNSFQNRTHLHIRYIPENEISLFFSSADLCVLPYKTATQSGITGIAYHFDVPVLVTDTGGLKESVEDGITGLIVRKPEPKEIADKINYYFRSNLKPTLEKNISNITNKNSWQSFAESVIEFAKSIQQ